MATKVYIIYYTHDIQYCDYMERQEIKLLRISIATWNKVKTYARYGDTHDDVINNMLNKLDKLSKVGKPSKVGKQKIKK
ncbi:unnamed protein product [marine sediment metagenome]|uniref:Uncharacterized protein n=1 Tax=marine sediment metagenome TaxID=412755 RepID=X1Q960_9ZZZZ